MVNWVDYSIIGCIVISATIGLVRGFVREAISMVTWVCAIALGLLYCERVSSLFSSISVQGIRLLLAFLLLVLATLIIGGLLNFLLTRLVALTGLGATDRLIGMLFGILRGGVIISVLILMMEIPLLQHWKTDPAWLNARLVPTFHSMAHWIKSMLPPDLIEKLQKP